jgi:hypothetical protein
MRLINSSALVLALCVGATAAYAGEADTAKSCQSAGSQVSQALGSAAQNAEAAREKKLGFQACNAGFYEQGMKHYARAMELLGTKLSST